MVAVHILFGGRILVKSKSFEFKKLVYYEIFALYNGNNRLEEISV
jgi:hypothetical protein